MQLMTLSYSHDIITNSVFQTTPNLTYFTLQTNSLGKDRSDWHDWQVPNLVEDKRTGNTEKKAAPCIRPMKYSRYFSGTTLGDNVLRDS